MAQSKANLYSLGKGIIALLLLATGYLIKEEISDTKYELREFNSNIKETTIEVKETRVMVSNHEVQLGEIKEEQKEIKTDIGVGKQAIQNNMINIVENRNDIEILKTSRR